jgi:2-phosphosulfolactate phosphatase
MSRELRVHLLPELFDPGALRGGVAVVIDVLRASTTIVHALANGASAVVPVAEVDEALRVAANLGRGSVLLGGERGGIRIEGFNLDNSPLAYSRDVVAGKTVVFTTTNGTRALLRSSHADRILIGAFTNLDAIVASLVSETRPVHIVCAGTDGHITGEDALCAGAIASNVEQLDTQEFAPDDSREIAVSFYRSERERFSALEGAIANGRGGRNLRDLGYDADLKQAALCNLHPVLPVYDPRSQRITLDRLTEDSASRSSKLKLQPDWSGERHGRSHK